MPTTKEVAERFDVTPSAVLHWLARGIRLRDGRRIKLVPSFDPREHGLHVKYGFRFRDEDVSTFATTCELKADGLTVKQITRQLGVDSATVYRWIKHGVKGIDGRWHKLKTNGHYIGRSVLKTDLDAFLKLRRQAADARSERALSRMVEERMSTLPRGK